jgi:Tol biopolymer transport system component
MPPPEQADLSLQVTVSTTGVDLDPNGYSVFLNWPRPYVDERDIGGWDALAVDVASIDTVRFRFETYREGSFVVGLAGLSYNCRVTGENIRWTKVADPMHGETAFDVTCSDTASSPTLHDRILFISERGRFSGFYAMNTDGSDPTILAEPFEDDRSYYGLSGGEVSPDGKVITFTGFFPSTHIFLMSADGSNVVPLTSEHWENEHPAWSPDGTKIAYSCAQLGLGGDLCIIDAYGGRPTQITGGHYPVWSPDGARVAFWGSEAIFVVDADGSDAVRVIDLPPPGSSPAWSPDGTRIAFVTHQDGNQEVYVVNADGSNPVNLTNHVANDSDPRWSPDGSKIAFHSDRGDGLGDIYTMNADGSNTINLTNHVANDTDPRWSPDGTKIVFTSARDRSLEIYAVNADGTGLANLTNHPARDRAARWCP